MSAALFITLEREIPGFDPFVNGKALSRAEESLDQLASELGVTPLMEFYSQDPEAARGFIEDAGVDADEVDLPDEEWFEAREGLRSVDALLDHLSQNPGAIEHPAAVVAELQEFQTVLRRAADEGVRWHLEVDF